MVQIAIPYAYSHTVRVYSYSTYQNTRAVHNSQTSNFLQGTITCSISAREDILLALILQAIAPCKKLEVWPRETIVE